ncbi:hypothetical protein L7H23_11650 [Sphingopyxis sp. BSN-002]|uniref:hypothetical protein n=1 Tax=Sphingopyxis sp. BSN-002 TaxID=2911495 RepID=UPI001EDAC524|nr:hypothetical protein [Sphingopyxis sp. BSN-002]UKK83218.1 hypothetical protein L7H23_11650 [Sphingopyxis sp. BSN-002]
MPRLMLPAALLLLAACSGGDDKAPPDDATATGSPDKADPAASDGVVDADLPAEAKKTPAAPEAERAVDGDGIPEAIRGRWALKAADCTAKRGTDLTALVIDATNLRFYESHGELVRVRSSGATQVLADYKFSGEGQDWDQRVQLELAGDGKTLVLRDQGKGAAAEPMRYTRCT